MIRTSDGNLGHFSVVGWVEERQRRRPNIHNENGYDGYLIRRILRWLERGTKRVNNKRPIFSKDLVVWLVVLVAVLWLALPASDSLRADSPSPTPTNAPSSDALTFVRIQYDSTGGFGESWYQYEGRNWQRWETDYPQAESNLILRLKELTSLSINPEPIVRRLTDPDLADYPFIFMSDVGWQLLSKAERSALKRYLESGGFLWVDDFWGQAEWQNFVRNIGTLDPRWKLRPIPQDHPIFTIVYPLKGCPQVPARIFFAQSGLPFDPPNVHRYPNGGYDGVRKVNFVGLFDSEDRLLAVATHNSDIGDGWEREGESKEFFERFSIQSYAITINILVYAMTH